jgi:hypothetical protein
MAHIVRDTDNVCEIFTSAGATITLGGAKPNCRSFSSITGIANGDTLWLVGEKGAEKCVGIWTYNVTTLTQTTPWYSTNGNVAVNFSSGVGQVFCDAPSRLFDELNLKEITVASATTTDIGAVHGAKILISGTTTITGLGTTIDKRRFVRFSGALTLTHHATSLILPGGANITTVAGDTALFASDASGNWRCYGYFRGDRRAVGADGTVGAPAFSFESDPDTGIYRIAANNIGVAVNGAKVLDISSSGASAPQFAPTVAPSTAAHIDTSGMTGISIANGGNAAVTAGSYHGFMFITEYAAAGFAALYGFYGGAVWLISTDASGTWVAPTTTPGAGKMSVAFNGGVYKIYNNVGSTGSFKVALTKVA